MLVSISLKLFKSTITLILIYMKTDQSLLEKTVLIIHKI